MSRPKKPYFIISIFLPNEEPKKDEWTSADLRYSCGRLRIKVADNYPGAADVVAQLALAELPSGKPDLTWGGAVRRVVAFATAHPEHCVVSYPSDWSLQDEVDSFTRVKAPVAVSGG